MTSLLKDFGEGYEVDVDGNIYTKERVETIPNRWGTLTTRTYSRRLMKPWSDKRGYLYVTLAKEGSDNNTLVHRIVCTAFHGPPPDGKSFVNHKNLNKSDNRAENLEWVSLKENSEHAAALGAVRGFYGEQKLVPSADTDSRVSSIINDSDSLKEASKKLGVHDSTLRRYRRKRSLE